MQRDFLFLVTDVPVNMLVRDVHYFTAQLDEQVKDALAGLGRKLPDLEKFLPRDKSCPVFGIGIRNHFYEEKEAADRAWNVLNGIVDAYSLAIDGNAPTVCPYLLFREGDSPDATVRAYAEGAWATIHPKDPDSGIRWEEVKRRFSERLLTYFDVAGRTDQKGSTPLCHQLLYSARMFRHGAETHVFGIQYLCKFSALEGIVCGAATRNKEAMLKDRLGTLFRNCSAVDRAGIKRLWELRCTASHQAKAFPFEDAPDAVYHSAHIEAVEHLFRGTLVFALEHLDSCATVDALWTMAASYNLPDFAFAERPADMPRLAVLSCFLNRQVPVAGAGSAFDRFYSKPAPTAS